MSLKDSLVLAVSMLALIYAADQCKTIYSVSDRILQGFLIRSIPHVAVDNCITKCEEEPNCFSTNYLFSTKTCQLNNATAERHPKNFVAWHHAMYIGSLVREEVMATASCNQTCGGVCVSVPGSSSSTCVCLQSNPMACQSDDCIPKALGMEDGKIKDEQISASSTHQPGSLYQSRLNSGTAWTPITDDNSQWLTITFNSVKIVTKIATQGHKTNWYWTKTYKLQYKQSGSSWADYMNAKIFSGNTEKGDAIVNNPLSPPVVSDSIRIRPVTYSGRIALRIELYGCSIVA